MCKLLYLINHQNKQLQQSLIAALKQYYNYYSANIDIFISDFDTDLKHNVK